MKKYFFGLLLFIFAVQHVPAQNKAIDSLQTVLKTEKEDTNKVTTLNNIARQIYLRSKFDSALYYANEAKILAEEIKYQTGIAIAYSNLGNVYMSMGNYSEALKSHFASLNIQTKINNKLGIASSNNNIGNIYYYQGNYPKALKRFLAAMTIYDSLQTQPRIKSNLAAAYNNLGIVYYSQKNFPEALKNYFNALKIRIEINDKHGQASTYGNIGTIYFSENNFSDALKNYSASLKIKNEIGDQQGIADVYGNIGLIYFTQGNYELALRQFFSSAKLSEKIGAEMTLGNAYTNIGETYLKQGKNTEAAEYLNKSLLIGKKIGSNDLIKDNYSGLSELDSTIGNWKGAFENHKLFIAYRDSLINEANTKKITQDQMNFDFEQKEIKAKAEQEKLDVLNQEKLKRQRLINWTTGCSLGFMLLISLLLFNRFRLKQKNEHQKELNQKQKEQAIAVMETQEQERKRIAEDLHDSLGHLLSTTKLNLQTLPENQKIYFGNSLQLLNQASTEMRNITFNLMPQTLEEEGLIPAIHELVTKTTNSGSIKIVFQTHNMETVFLEKQAQFNIYRIIQESVNNILKYAEAKEITIQLIKQDNQLVIMIEDDGKGFDIKQVKKGRGLKNITSRSEWLNGKIAIDSAPERGTTITIQLPV